MEKLTISSSMFTQDQIVYILELSFGCWVDALYGYGNELFYEKLGRKLSYEEEAEIFLALFKRMIDDGLILAHSPIDSEPEKEIQGDKFWNVSSDRMVAYIRSVFPKDLKHLNGNIKDTQDEWGTFWYYDCPKIRWVDKEIGTIY